MKKLAYLIALISTHSLYAQQPSCNCNQALEKLVTKVEAEYPGFSEKTKDQLSYSAFKEDVDKEAKGANDDSCPRILKKYIDFFKDPHLWVGSNGTPFSASTNNPTKSIAINIPDFENKIQSTKDVHEGVWINEGYKFGVKKTSKDEYTGFIIEAKSNLWKSKDIKFKLLKDNKFEYALLDGTIKKGDYKLYDGVILYLSGVNVSMIKQTPKPIISPKQIEEKLKGINGFYLKKITDKTIILNLPSFESQHLKTINDLIEQNKELLEESENLIIDLRDNPGGTTDAYQKLLPYISRKYIRNTGAEFLATKTYINNLETYKRSIDKDTSTEEIDKLIKKLKENVGQFVNLNKTNNPNVYIETVDVSSKKPKQIIILANKGTGSSAEYFLFIAKQSAQVKIFGIPSYGALDYGNAYLVDFGCSGYQVFMPTYRALRLPDYPIDNIGIQPDIYLDSSVKNWVAFTLEYLEN